MIIASDVPHQLDSNDDRQLLILLDHETRLAKQLISKLLKNSSVKEMDNIIDPSLIREQVMKDIHLHTCRMAKSLFDLVIHSINLPEMENPVITDSRIEKALDFMKRLDIKHISAKEIAERVSLSESRLIHLFKEQTGIPIRRYLLWLRLIEALKHIFNNVSLTEAAHNAYFSDSAHLSRTFKSMFGVTPSEIFKKSRLIKFISCLE